MWGYGGHFRLISGFKIVTPWSVFKIVTPWSVMPSNSKHRCARRTQFGELASGEEEYAASWADSRRRHDAT